MAYPYPLPWPGDPAPFDRARLESLCKLDLLDAVGMLRDLDVAKLDIDTMRAIKVRDIFEDLGGPRTDPVPDPYHGSMLRLHPDAIARMGTEELHAAKHRINAEMTRLKSLEDMVGQQLKSMDGKGRKK